MQPAAIIIGASTGIGLGIARLLNARGYRLGLAARRIELLREHAKVLSGVATVRALDLLEPESARTILQELFQELGRVDYLYISSGTGYLNRDLDWPPEDETIRVNSLGFAAVASAGFLRFMQQGHGHIVGITSMAALRGSADAPAYSASKAFASRYLKGCAIGLPGPGSRFTSRRRVPDSWTRR